MTSYDGVGSAPGSCEGDAEVGRWQDSDVTASAKATTRL